ncbi:MAG: hypothetical protein WAL40_17555 [Rhodoplanes sp.]
MTLVATTAAFAALGIDPRDVAEDAEPAADEAATNVEAEPKQRPKTSRTKEPKSRRTRDGSKQAQLIAMLRRAKGSPSTRSPRPWSGSRTWYAAQSPAR